MNTVSNKGIRSAYNLLESLLKISRDGYLIANICNISWRRAFWLVVVLDSLQSLGQQLLGLACEHLSALGPRNVRNWRADEHKDV